jgi:hypothetical protein
MHGDAPADQTADGRRKQEDRHSCHPRQHGESGQCERDADDSTQGDELRNARVAGIEQRRDAGGKQPAAADIDTALDGNISRCGPSARIRAALADAASGASRHRHLLGAAQLIVLVVFFASLA